MHSPPDILRRELKARGRSVYSLAKEAARRGLCTEHHVYRFMAGHNDVSATIFLGLLDILGVKLPPSK